MCIYIYYQQYSIVENFTLTLVTLSTLIQFPLKTGNIYIPVKCHHSVLQYIMRANNTDLLF